MVTDPRVQPFQELYPFQSNVLSIDTLKYHYLDEGEGDPLLMLHGNPTWSFYYRSLVRGLRHQNRCVVPDHIGCGLSDKPQDYDYTLERHIENLERLVDHLQLDPITLVLHDWGGAIGMGFAVRHPEKIKRIVLFNTAAFLAERIPLSINLCRNNIFGKVAIQWMNGFAGLGPVFCTKRPGSMTPMIKKGYLAPYDTPANRIANFKFVQDIPMSPEVPSYGIVKHIESQLGYFRDKPVMIVWGKRILCLMIIFCRAGKTIFLRPRCTNLKGGTLCGRGCLRRHYSLDD